VDISGVLDRLHELPAHKQRELLALLDRFNSATMEEDARHAFLPFVKYLWPDFIQGRHHKIVADLFDEVIDGKEERVIINMAPRHTKSEFASIFLPAYFLGRNPKKKIIMASHTAELAVGFGRKVRDLVNREDFTHLFPGTTLSADSKAAGRWSTAQGGEYFAIGVGGAVAGKGADLFVIDDPLSEQEQVIGESNPEIYDKVLDWYEGGPRQRLQPGGKIILVMTRWHKRDLTGQLVRRAQENEDADQWKVVELPAIMPSGEAMWPEYWSTERLLKTKASIPISKWQAQYQQHPTSEEGALIKREYWQDWVDGKPPPVDSIIQAWDTAFTKSTRADYSACTTWGVWFNEDEGRNQLILLDAIRGKWEFPELKQRAKSYYKEWEPDIVLVEGRAAGQPMIYEMRQMDIPVVDWVVGRGSRSNPNDKISRVNNVTDIFASKNVWAPLVKTWAQEVVEECASFPAGDHDDYVDTVVMAVSRFRQGGWITTDNDDWDEPMPRKQREYY
jgi:predicted phage terminase large subunit-like protein